MDTMGGGVCMTLLFEICFFVGIGLTLVSLIAGQCSDIIGADGLDIGDIGTGFLLPLSPMIYVLFCTVFGGMGLILLKVCPSLSMFLILAIAIITGIIISTGFYQVIIVPLKKAQNTSAPAQEELLGVIAKVQENIPENGYGEIAYVVNGNSYIAPAKTTDGHSITKGCEVTICWIEQYVFYVIELDRIDEIQRPSY